MLVSHTDIWLFDLCRNTWRQTRSTVADGRMPVYDVARDLIVFIESWHVVTYDVDRDLVTEQGPTPVLGLFSAVYDPVTGLIVVRKDQSNEMWTYDAGADAWRELSQAGELPTPESDWGDQLLSYDASADRIVLYVPQLGHPRSTYEFDLRTGTWTLGTQDGPTFGNFDWNGPLMQIAYDEANRLSVTFDARKLAAYDTDLDTWETIFETTDARSAHGFNHNRVAVAYDPINRRVVFVGGDPLGRAGEAGVFASSFPLWATHIDVTAFDLETRTWTELAAGE